jgi:hypothetical protein
LLTFKFRQFQNEIPQALEPTFTEVNTKRAGENIVRSSISFAGGQSWTLQSLLARQRRPAAGGEAARAPWLGFGGLKDMKTHSFSDAILKLMQRGALPKR